MSVYEIDRFIENQHRSARNDAFVVPEATLDDLDSKLLSGWLFHARESSFGRMDAMDDMTVLANRRVIGEDGSGKMRPTVAGLMAMGAYSQKFFPRLNVVFTSYPTPQKGDARTAGSRFSDSMDIDGRIPEMIVNAAKAASRNMKHGAIIKGALREDVPDYPLAAVREAVANALMHRDYSIESQGSPVLAELFPDRLEMSNPGGLYGSLTVDKLGTRGSTISRNQFLARILEDVPFTDYDGSVGHVVENRGTGYPTITGELEKALMDQPVVFSSLDEFRIIFRHRRMTEEENSYSKTDVEEAVSNIATLQSSYRSVGPITLRIPKLRMGSYFPEDLLVRCSRVDRAVIAAVSEMVVNGGSTRKVERVASTMGVDRMSASQVSRICESLDDVVEDLQTRAFGDVGFPYLWLDATCLKCGDSGHVSSTAIVCGDDGYRRLVGPGATDTESHLGWRGSLQSLRERGVNGVACVTSDAHEGLRRAPTEKSSARSRVVQVFPSRKSLIRMLGAVLSKMDEDWSARRWFTVRSIAEAYEDPERRKPAPKPTYEGTAAQHAIRIIELAMPDNVDSIGEAA